MLFCPERSAAIMCVVLSIYLRFGIHNAFVHFRRKDFRLALADAFNDHLHLWLSSPFLTLLSYGAAFGGAQFRRLGLKLLSFASFFLHRPRSALWPLRNLCFLISSQITNADTIHWNFIFAFGSPPPWD